MRTIFGRRAELFGWAGVLGLALSPALANAATVTPVTAFGANPTGIGMYLYTPTNVVAKPPIVVGVHACHGKGLDVCSSGNSFAQQADKYGFLLICPSAVSSDGCWDVHSTADLTHGGAGDAAGIISMVNYVIQNKNGDASRVYAAGHSSGGMMTNVLLGSYPDVFKAGAAFAGVPFACFAQGSVDSLGWSSTCANGNVTMTGAQWGALVRGAYPGYTGPRPRIQLWHGTTDAIVAFHNFGEEIKQWTDVLGASATPVSTESNALQATWIRTRYADSAGVVQVEAIQETGQPHNLVVNGAEAIHFFGLDGSGSAADAGVGDASGGSVRDAGTGGPVVRADAESRGDATSGAPGTGGAGDAGGAAGTGGSSGAGSSGAGASGAAGGAGGSGGGSAAGGSTATGGGTTAEPGTGGSAAGTPPAAEAGPTPDRGGDSGGSSCSVAASGGARRTSSGVASALGWALGVALYARRRRNRQ